MHFLSLVSSEFYEVYFYLLGQNRRVSSLYSTSHDKTVF